jgi:hypothetical protein
MVIQSSGEVDIASNLSVGGSINGGIITGAPVQSTESAFDADAPGVVGYGVNTSFGTGTGGIGVVGYGGGGNGQCGSECSSPGAVFVGGDGIDASTDGATVPGYAGNFSGDVNITGTLYADVKDFKIDHPLDPANKYLNHSSVESSEMMNLYTGNVTTDELGLATVHLPDWFEAENADFRYQLTTIGRDAHAWIAKEVANKQFQIATNATNVKVSWQITAIRQDAYAKAHPLVVEETKNARERGFYKHPELYGQPAEKQTEWGRRPQQMQRLKAMREAHKAAAQKATTKPAGHATSQVASEVH